MTTDSLHGSDAALAEALAIIAGQVQGIREALTGRTGDDAPEADGISAVGRWVAARIGETLPNLGTSQRRPTNAGLRREVPDWFTDHYPGYLDGVLALALSDEPVHFRHTIGDTCTSCDASRLRDWWAEDEESSDG